MELALSSEESSRFCDDTFALLARLEGATSVATTRLVSASPFDDSDFPLFLNPARAMQPIADFSRMRATFSPSTRRAERTSRKILMAMRYRTEEIVDATPWRRLDPSP